MFTSARPKHLIALGVMLSVLLVSASPARAFTPPPCEATECPTTAPTAWAAHSAAVLAALAAFETSMYANWMRLNDALGREADQSTSSTQKISGPIGINADRQDNTITQNAIASARLESASQLRASRTSCITETTGRRVAEASANAGALVRTQGTATTALLSNASGTAGERGKLAYISKRYETRLNKYCNTETMEVACTPSVGADADLFPQDTLLKKGGYANDTEYETAKDTLLNLIGNVVDDSLQGAALDRLDGKALSVTKAGEQAKTALAASLLTKIAARRVTPAGGKSLYDLQAMQSLSDGALAPPEETMAGELKGQNMAAASSMIRSASQQLMVLRNYVEEWASLQAVGMAMDVTQNASKSSASFSTSTK